MTVTLFFQSATDGYKAMKYFNQSSTNFVFIRVKEKVMKIRPFYGSTLFLSDLSSDLTAAGCSLPVFEKALYDVLVDKY